MRQIVVRPQPNRRTPTDWIRRRAKLPAATSALIVELAYAGRIAALGDRGQTLAERCAEAAQ